MDIINKPLIDPEKEPSRGYLNVRLDHGRLLKLKKVAIYKGFDVSNMVRLLIDSEYNKLPPEAR